MGDNIVTLEIDKNALKDASKTNQPLKCPKCTRTFSNVGHLKCHFYRVHSEFRLAACTINMPPSPPPSEICDICKKSFPSKKELDEHECIDDSPPPANKCGECDRIFTKKSSLFRHCKRVHEKSHVCSICDKEFASKSYLSAHYRTHIKEKMFACDICSEAFTLKETLETHRLTHDNEFVCKVCKRQFTRKCYLVRHSVSHKKK
ncbi:zinc finger protein OBI1-like [Argiope bruennichi]|uniref:zinc finger protein OBI1-like n=1 Tax=Argiope bruennichi TaxID=94029 RepID=UPI0024948473|nr:zinc finger protein OBI1-like [Argiope bruennichi]